MMGYAIIAAAEHAEGAHEAAPPLIDIDGTLVLQFLLFLVVLVAFRKLVFDPFLRAKVERDERTEGERSKSADLDTRAAQKLAEYEARIAKEKQAGEVERLKLREQARQREREILEHSRLETARLVEEQRKSAERSGAAAKQSLQAETPLLARKLASKILGREVA